MKLHEHGVARSYRIQGYGDGAVMVNGQPYRAPLIVAPHRLHADWIADLAALEPAALDALWAEAPRIVLLGAVGPVQAAARRIHADCLRHHAALEAMDLGAACRTYNVLAQEERPVIALLFP